MQKVKHQLKLLLWIKVKIRWEWLAIIYLVQIKTDKFTNMDGNQNVWIYFLAKSAMIYDTMICMQCMELDINVYRITQTRFQNTSCYMYIPTYSCLQCKRIYINIYIYIIYAYISFYYRNFLMVNISKLIEWIELKYQY